MSGLSGDRAFSEGRFSTTLTIRLLDGSREQALQHQIDLTNMIEAGDRASVIAASLEENDGTDAMFRTFFQQAQDEDATDDGDEG